MLCPAWCIRRPRWHLCRTWTVILSCGQSSMHRQRLAITYTILSLCTVTCTCIMYRCFKRLQRYGDRRTATLGSLAFLGAWSAAEIVRYSFYMHSSLVPPPYPLKWLRYSAFIVLYPIGISLRTPLTVHRSIALLIPTFVSLSWFHLPIGAYHWLLFST